MRGALLLLSFLVGAFAFPSPPDASYNPATSPEYRRFEGDILIPDDEATMVRGKRGAPDVSNPNKKWPTNQVISYKIVGAYDATFAQLIRDAFKFWTDNTCLTYQENGPTTPQLQVLKQTDCSSIVGRQSGAATQPIYLDNGCNSFGTVVHEIAHSIGLGHTQSRADRDSYITINQVNLNPKAANNFAARTSKDNDNFGVEYDYSSVLHYSADAFSLNGKDVITAKDANAQLSMGQRVRAAFSDVKMINAFYDCAQKCPSPSLKCQNGGIINSKTCNSCICPYMFTGSDCSQRHPGKGQYVSKPECGAELTAASSWKSVHVKFGERAAQYDAECLWHFKAPTGRRVEIRLSNADIFCDKYCQWNGLEVYARGFANGPYKLCCELNGKVFQSRENILPVTVFSKYHIPQVTFEYRTI